MSEGSEEITEAGNANLLKRKFKVDVDEEFEKKEVKKPPMPTYGKYNILKILKENHCLIADEDQLNNAFPRNKRYNLDDIKSKTSLINFRPMFSRYYIFTIYRICKQICTKITVYHR